MAKTTVSSRADLVTVMICSNDVINNPVERLG